MKKEGFSEKLYLMFFHPKWKKSVLETVKKKLKWKEKSTSSRSLTTGKTRSKILGRLKSRFLSRCRLIFFKVLRTADALYLSFRSTVFCSDWCRR